MRRIFSTITALMALLLPAVHASAAFSADDRYIVRARQAEKENDPAMAISMYSRLLAEYKPGAPKEEQRQYADIFMQASLLSRACSRFLESLEFASQGLQAANNAGDRELTMKFLGNIGTSTPYSTTSTAPYPTTGGVTGYLSKRSWRNRSISF